MIVCLRISAAKNTALGFAIPIDLVMQIVSQLKDKGYVARPYIGAAFVSLTPQIIEAERKLSKHHFPVDVEDGILAVKVRYRTSI